MSPPCDSKFSRIFLSVILLSAGGFWLCNEDKNGDSMPGRLAVAFVSKIERLGIESMAGRGKGF